MRHMDKAAVAAERAGVPISALLKSRDDSASAGGAPEAEAEQHARINAQADHQSVGRRRESFDALHAEERNNSTARCWPVQQTARSTLRSVPYMSEQFAVRRLMEVKERHAGRDRHERVRQPTAAPTTMSTCVKPADAANKTVPEDWMIPRQEAKTTKA